MNQPVGPAGVVVYPVQLPDLVANGEGVARAQAMPLLHVGSHSELDLDGAVFEDCWVVGGEAGEALVGLDVAPEHDLGFVGRQCGIFRCCGELWRR